MQSSQPSSFRLPSPMQAYRARRDASRRGVLLKYRIHGFISSGTYGRVYKASILAGSEGADRPGDRMGVAGQVYAIKKMKPENVKDETQMNGISQSACREIALNREIDHDNIISLREVILEGRAVYMVFAYAEHDFLQIIHHHHSSSRASPLPLPVLKSLLFQLLNGVAYLHANFILHRDLKPANILVTDKGVVKIGDLGLARVFLRPLQPLTQADKLVVTIWYRAPELLLGARHYTTAIDMWAVGCIFAELLTLKPIFKGEEIKLDSQKKTIPFQRDQFSKICDVLGTPSTDDWPLISSTQDYHHLLAMEVQSSGLRGWIREKMRELPSGGELLTKLFMWDPDRRITARESLGAAWFQEAPLPTRNAFASAHRTYPSRRVTSDDTVPHIGANPPPAAAVAAQMQMQQQQAVMTTTQQASVFSNRTSTVATGQAGGRWSVQQQPAQGQGMGARKRPRIE